MSDSILLIGGAGFIGSHLAKRLLSEGHHVRIYTRPRTQLHRLNTVHKHLEFEFGDFSDPEAMHRALHGIDKVVHLICSTVPITSPSTLHFDLVSNLIPTQKLLDECIRKKIQKLVFLSSGGAIYGEPQSLRIPETHPRSPVAEYALGKLLIENILDFQKRTKGLPASILRLSNPYGPGQDTSGKQGLVAVAFGRAMDGLPLQLRGSGKETRDYIFIDDTIDSISLALQHPDNITLNIGSGKGHTTREILDLVQQISGKPIVINSHPAPTSDISTNILDPSLAEKTLGWKPRTSLNEGLKITWKHLQQRY